MKIYIYYNYEKSNRDLSRRLLKKSLQQYFADEGKEIYADDIYLKKNENGKPYVDNIKYRKKQSCNVISVEKLEMKPIAADDFADVEFFKISSPHMMQAEGKSEESVESCRDLHFNISHSESLWICAISTCRVGIDVQIMRKKQYNKLSRRFFSENENELVKLYGEEGFYMIWTAKEAATKLRGKKLSHEIGKEIYPRDFETVISSYEGELSIRYFDIEGEEGKFKVCLCTAVC